MVARGRFELPSAGDSYPIHEGIQSPLGTLACLARNAHAMLDHYTTGLRRLRSSPGFIRGLRVRTRGSLYTCRKAYMALAVRHVLVLKGACGPAEPTRYYAQ